MLQKLLEALREDVTKYYTQLPLMAEYKCSQPFTQWD